jgi:hypothetical protein
MHLISLLASDHQKSRLRNGHKVRVKHGAGFNLIVSPDTYHLVSRAFNKNKGISMQLSPEEIEMNRAPTPEMQRQIMGHNEHLILPNATGHLIKGSGIGDFFKNLGKQIKEKIYDPVYEPIKKAVINPIKGAYENIVPEGIRRDISTATKIGSPAYLLQDAVSKVREGKNPVEIFKQYREDLKHLNQTKNKVIQSSPVLTEAYKKGVMTTAGLGSAALGTTLGLNPATGALAGAAGTMAARELLKAEGYGLHHAIEHGIKHHFHELKHLGRPIGGRITLKHVKDFFVNAGRKIAPAIKHGAKEVHNFILNNPELAKKIKEHGSKLAGAFAKAGANYLSGDEKYGEEAEKYGSKFGDEQIHKNLGYGIGDDIERGGREGIRRVKGLFGRGIGDDIERGGREGIRRVKGLFGRGVGDDIERGGREGIRRVKNLFGRGVGDDIERGVRQGADRVKNLFGRGLHHAIEHGERHHYDDLKHHSSPIGGALKMSHVTNFFKNIGQKVKDVMPHLKAGAQKVHHFILDNPELAKKIKEHGSKLAGMFAKAGANYLSGDEKYGEEAEKYGSKFGDEQIHKNLGYGLYGGSPSSGNGLGTGLYAGKMRGTGPFHSFNTLKDASDAYVDANAELAGMSKHTIHSQHTQRPIQKYYEGDNAPPSRGTGIHPHTAHHIHQNDHLHHRGHTTNPHDTNLIRGRGTVLEHNTQLPPALVSQPYGANFHMQFQLPPQYQKYNDGTYTY